MNELSVDGEQLSWLIQVKALFQTVNEINLKEVVCYGRIKTWINKFTKYIRENNGVKGKPNITLCTFCKWVNESLLQNNVLDPGFPRNIVLETVQKWLHQLGFTKLTAKKGNYVHEVEDVIQHWNKFLRKMITLGF